ncbi:hypothetical protein F4820DRAFT_468745 [Hypoxylon rubiginosum]|uniref:Uncharacterized protein n=1 Tax=Hypoxylon rubiginosum TaxID=110542 RepID=A0ACB9Z672_9PEZI|nr:hypothetical protein F4820DRAFT_468745 [Hypoxylon rubiginosum]
MAWPDSREDIQRGAPKSGIVHGDLHQGNILLGAPPNDFEHRITPILKLIDFGGTEQYPPEEEADHMNIYDIGQAMVGLINLNRGRESDYAPYYLWNNRELMTDATALIPTPLSMDDVLCTIVCACMATNPNNRPTLSTLLKLGLQGLDERTPAAYGYEQAEQDSSIFDLWKRIIYDAQIDDDDDDDDPPDDWSPFNKGTSFNSCFFDRCSWNTTSPWKATACKNNTISCNTISSNTNSSTATFS